MLEIFWQINKLQQDVANGTYVNPDRISASAPDYSPTPPRDDPAGVNERLDQLLLVCAAMWELISEKTGLTHEDLVNRIAILDARDGAADGKLTYTPTKCPKCSRIIIPRHERCLYCGTTIPVDCVFKTI